VTKLIRRGLTEGWMERVRISITDVAGVTRTGVGFRLKEETARG
jgi:hypothetical protein